MAKNNGTVTVKVLGDTSKFNKAMDGAGTKVGNFAKNGVKALGAVGVAAAALGIAAGKALLDIGAQFDSAFDNIRVGTGATGEAFEGLKDDFRAVASEIPASLADVSTAIADLNTRTGLAGEPLQELAGQILELSRLTGTDSATNIEKLTRLYGDWGVATEDMAGANDALFRASQASGVAVEELADKAVQFGAPLRQIGFDMDESVALFAKWNKEGVNTEAVMSGLKIGVGKFAAAGEDVPTAFANAIEAIKAFESDSEATGKAIELFGQRAGPDMAAAIREGRFDLDSYLDAMNNGQDTIMGLSKETMSMGEQFQIFKNKALLAIEPIATRVFTWLSDWFETNGPAIEAAIAGFADFMQNRLIPAFEALWERAQPILEQLWEGIQSFVTDVQAIWDKWGAGIMAVARILFTWLQGAFQGVMTIIGGIWDTLVGLLTGDWERMWEGMKSIFEGAWDLLLNTVTSALDLLWEIFKGVPDAIWEAVKDNFGRLVDLGKELVKKIVDGIKSAPGAIGSALGGLVPNSIGGIDVNPFRADGGPVSGGKSYVVGERGPELFTPSRSGTIVSNETAAATAGGGTGGGDVNISVQTNANPAQIGKEVVAAMKMAGGFAR